MNNKIKFLFWILFLILLIVYLKLSSLILNETFIDVFILVFFWLLIYLLIKKIHISFLISFMLMVFYVFLDVKIHLDNNSFEKYIVKINSIKVRRNNVIKVYFKLDNQLNQINADFLKKEYKINYINQKKFYDRIKNDLYLEIIVTKGFFNSYILKEKIKFIKNETKHNY